MTFSSMIDLWQDCYQRIKSGADVVNVRETPEFAEKQGELENVFLILQPLAERFLSLLIGRERGKTPVEQAASSALCFFPRVLGISSVDELPELQAAKLADALQASFFLGMACHLILCSHPGRTRIDEVDLTALFADYLKESLKATSHVRSYSRSANNIPRDIFEVEYAEMELFVKKNLGLGFWKRGKVRTNYYNTFCSGILLPMMSEICVSDI